VPLRVALAASAVVLLVSACGGNSARRHAVSDYIDQVNRVQIAMRAPLNSVQKAYRDFGRKNGPSLTKETPRLVRAESTIQQVDKRLRALKPPPDAHKLHVLLVRLVDQEAEVAHELVLLALFSPRFSAALQPLGAASQTLQASFKGAKKAKTQADALDVYAVSLAAVLAKLKQLEAPPAFVPTLVAQKRTLATVRTSAIELADGLRKNRRAVLPTLIQRFTNAGLSNQSLTAQRARIAAIEAYNKRIADLSALARRVNTERLRLDKSLG
jgi:hypothetical protein